MLLKSQGKLVGEGKKMNRAVLRGLLPLLLAVACLRAQRDLGTITGTITDPQGSVIPSAKVTITEDATALSYSVVTSETGDYARPALKPGTYTVTAEAPGFRRVAQQNVVVTGGDRVGVSLTLPVGDIAESVQVAAESAILQTENTALGASLNAQKLSEIPLGGQRVFSFLARMSPGVLPPETGARDAVGGGFSANGVRSNGQNNFLLNGVDNNVNVIDFLNQTAFVIGPSVEAIGEMQVLTSGYNAEYGRGAGGVVNVNLKSGTNELHGALFEILQNDKLNAKRWEFNKAGSARGPIKQNQFGAAAGAPIIKNRLFIFGDYQGTRIRSTGGAVQNLGYGGYYTIPTQAMVHGDFSSLLGPAIGTDALGAPIRQGQLYDPATQRTVNGQLYRDPFPNNMIPSGRFDPAAAKILALYPATNQPIPVGTFPQNDYFVSTPGLQNTDQGDTRVDFRLDDRDSIFGSLSWSNLNKHNGPPLPGALDGSPFNAVTEEDLGRNAQFSWTRVWKPNLISETRVAFSRLVTSRVGANPDTDLFKAFGIAGYDPTGPLNGGLPQTQFRDTTNSTPGRYSQIGANDWLPSKEFNNVWDFIQNVALVKGSHALKFGGEYRPIKLPFFQVPYPHGEMNPNQNDTAYPSTTNTLNARTGDPVASYLIGTLGSGQISTTNFVSSQKSAWAFYAQDDWKVTRNLTLNLGLRYELFTPIDEGFGHQSNFVYDNLTLYIPRGPQQDLPLPPNFASAFPNVTVSRGQIDSSLIASDKWDFGPRFGLAYRWREKTVIRLGYGIFYGGEENQGGNPNRGESVPFNESPNLDRSGNLGIFDPNPFFSGGVRNGVSGGYPQNVFSLNAPVAFRGVATNFRNGLVHKWNIALQRELRGQMAFELAYVGNHQAHQLFQPDPNACANLGSAAGISCTPALRPVNYIGGISGTASFGFGNYEGMTAKLEKRLSKGLQMLTSYTLGHALANTGTTLSGSTGFTVVDPRNYSSSYSNSAWDIRHNLVSSFLYELPFGRGKKIGGNMAKPFNMIAGNWQVNGVVVLHTGVPFTLRSNGCQGIWNACRPDLVPGKNPSDAPPGGRRPDQWFDTSAVAAPAPLTGGNLGLQSNYAPPTRNVDFSIFKYFPITERRRLEFRAESFNIANTPQFFTPNNNRQDTNFGKVTSTQAGSERHVQFELRMRF
jgi:hypothetical protein